MDEFSVLIRTKLHPPFLRQELVDRPRLQEQIDRGLHSPLTLVAAPAGFGKTTLVASEISHCGVRAAWLSIDKSDNQTWRFLSYLLAALREADPTIGSEAAQLLEVSQRATPKSILTSLINDINASRKELILVLDDYQMISNQEVHESMTFLLENLPITFHLIIATRSDPQLPLARLRARGQMVELRAADLRFTELEAIQFMNELMGLHLEKRSVSILEERTEGWITGLQMAALSMRDRKDVQGFIEGFSGTDRFILDYLVEEVLAAQPPEIQHFLRNTSILERLTAPLCDAIMAGGKSLEPGEEKEKTQLKAPSFSQSASVLEYLERQNLFLVSLDDERIWYRYHHLFADLLRVRLQKTRPETITYLCERAAGWFQTRHLWHEAIEYATRVRKYDFAEEIFREAILDEGLNFLYSIMQHLIEPFPLEIIKTSPILSLVKAIAMIEESQLDGIENLLRSAEKSFLSAPRTEEQNKLLGTLYAVQCNTASLLGDSAWIIEASEQVTRLMPRNSEVSVDALLHRGVAYYYEGNLNKAVEVWKEALEVSQANRFIDFTLSMLDTLGRTEMHRGRLNHAAEYFNRSFQVLAQEKGHFQDWSGATQRDYSDLLREQNHLDEASQVIDASKELCEKWESISGLGLCYLNKAKILLAAGDNKGAGEMAARIAELLEGHNLYPDLETLTYVFQARLLMEDGAFGEALRIVDNCLHSTCCRHALHREWALIAQARLFIIMGRPQEAFDLLTGQLDDAQKSGRGRNWLEMCLLLSQALKSMGDQLAAYQTLEEGLVFGRTNGHLRIFLDEGQPMQQIIAQWSSHADPGSLRQYAIYLLSQFDAELQKAETAQENTSIMQELVEPLSQRELEVLHLLSLGRTNKEIASQLIVASGTVKAHAASIYRKLDVANRTEAVARARELGILP